MTTKVTIEVEQTNCPTGQMVVGTTQPPYSYQEGGRSTNTVHVPATRNTQLKIPPFKMEYWVSGDVRVICREATASDVADSV